jgi:hypothetical protein
MSTLKKYSDWLFLKQWGLGFMKGDIREIIRKRKNGFSFQWLPVSDKNISYADPFIFKANDGKINVLFEKVTSFQLDGTISLMVCDESFKTVMEKTVLNNREHLSYPFVFRENGKTYVLPENSLGGSLYCYEFDNETRSFSKQKKILDLPLIDPTILKYNNKYWLFCTMLGEQLNSELYIFYADSLTGPYSAHAKNPVKSGLNGTRPAGNFIEVDGNIYRPSQNCSNYYGESITINKLTELSETAFSEEEHMLIHSNPRDEFNYGIHTINIVDDIIIVDGQKRHFQPVRQLGRKLKNIFN